MPRIRYTTEGGRVYEIDHSKRTWSRLNPSTFESEESGPLWNRTIPHPSKGEALEIWTEPASGSGKVAHVIVTLPIVDGRVSSRE